MKKLPAQADQTMGVVEIDGAGKGWLAPIDKRERHSTPSPIWAVPRKASWSSLSLSANRRARGCG
jgi:predicted NAD/FAD-dependent oxidoreductase